MLPRPRCQLLIISSSFTNLTLRVVVQEFDIEVYMEEINRVAYCDSEIKCRLETLA